jgi:hypothetical protein
VLLSLERASGHQDGAIPFTLVGGTVGHSPNRRAAWPNFVFIQFDEFFNPALAQQTGE